MRRPSYQQCKSVLAELRYGITLPLAPSSCERECVAVVAQASLPVCSEFGLRSSEIEIRAAGPEACRYIRHQAQAIVGRPYVACDGRNQSPASASPANSGKDSVNRARRFSRARAMRLFTVPTLIPKFSAISS